MLEPNDSDKRAYKYFLRARHKFFNECTVVTKNIFGCKAVFLNLCVAKLFKKH